MKTTTRDTGTPAQYHMHAGGEPATVERNDMDYGDMNAPAGAGNTATAHPHAVDTTKMMRLVSWRVLPLLALAYALALVEKTNIALAGEGIMRDLQVSARQFGIAASVYFVPYTLLPVPCALLARRGGPSGGLGGMCVCFALAAAATAAVRSAGGLYAARIALGLTEAGVVPFVSYVMSLFFGHEDIGTAIGEMHLWTGAVSIAMGPAAALFLLLGERFSNIMHDWQWLFVLEAVPALLTGIAIIMFMPDGPRQCSFLTRAEQRGLAARAEANEAERVKRSRSLAEVAEAAESGVVITGTNIHIGVGGGGGGAGGGHTSILRRLRRFGGPLGQLLKDRRVLALVFAHNFYVCAMYGSVPFFPIILSGEGERSIAFIAALDAFPTACWIIANYFYSKHSDATGERIGHMIGGILIGSGSIFALAWLSQGGYSFPIVYLSYVCFQIGVNIYSSPFRAYQADVLPHAASAQGFALVNGLGCIGGVIGPALSGALRDRTGSYAVPLAVLGFFLLISAGILALLLSFGEQPLPRKKSSSKDDDDEMIVLSPESVEDPLLSSEPLNQRRL